MFPFYSCSLVIHAFLIARSIAQSLRFSSRVTADKWFLRVILLSERLSAVQEDNDGPIAKPWTRERSVGRSIDFFVTASGCIATARCRWKRLFALTRSFSEILSSHRDEFHRNAGRTINGFIRSLKSPPRHRLICVFFPSLRRLRNRTVSSCFNHSTKGSHE